MSKGTQGTKESQEVCLRYVLRHPVAFREFWVPQVSKRRYWHRYTFSPVLLALNTGDATLAAGRGSGKSYAGIEPELAMHAISRPGEESMLTSFRKIHIMDRLERVLDYFDLPFFKLMVSRIIRSPSYVVELLTGHRLYGISVGDDPEARMAQGKHVSKLIVEEAHQYPSRAWLKLQGAKDPRGCVTLMVGVPDGRLDTPFRKADTALATFAERRFRISRRSDPYFDQPTKSSFAETLGGEDSDAFGQEVDAEWGQPVYSAWDLDMIYRCVDESVPLDVLEISGKLYRQQGITPSAACADLPDFPHPGDVLLAMDVGYSQPSEIGVFTHWRDRWELRARVRLVNRMEHDDQADIVDEIAKRYNAKRIAIDTTEGEGRAIAQVLETRGWGARVVRVSFTETMLAGYVLVDDVPEEVWEPVRPLSTRELRGLFARHGIALPKDDAIPMEFNQEREIRDQDGKTRVITPTTVHITDMMRVFAIMLFIETPPTLPSYSAEETFVDPEWGDARPWAPLIGRG